MGLLACAFSVGRVTGSNPHYRLGNQCRPGLSRGLTCGAGCPRVTVRAPVTSVNDPLMVDVVT